MGYSHRMHSTIRALLFIACSVLAWPSTAHAGRLVVLQFDGAGPAAQARLSLVRALMPIDGLTLVPQTDYVTQAEAVGVIRSELATPSGVRRGAAVSAVDAVIAGRTIRSGNRWQVRLSYFDADGNRRLQRDYPLVQGRFRQADLNRIVQYVTQRAVSASPSGVAAPTSPPPDRTDDASGVAARALPPETTQPGTPPPSGQPGWGPAVSSGDSRGRPAGDGRATDRSSSSGRDDRSGRSEFGGPDWATAGRRGGSGREDARNRPLVSVILGGGGANRSYLMQGANTSITYETTKPASGKGVALFPELGLLIQSFPAREGGSLVEGMGLEAGFSRGFVSSFFATGGSTFRVDTPVYRFHLDGRWRYRLLGQSPFSPELGLRAGFGIADFQAKVDNAAFTGVRHSSLRAGIEAAQPIVPNYLRLEAMIVALPMAFPGEAETRAFGEETKASGWTGRVGLAGDMRRSGGGPAWSASVERQVIRTEFVGTGTRDDGGSSEEAYLVVHAGVGFAF